MASYSLGEKRVLEEDAEQAWLEYSTKHYPLFRLGSATIGLIKKAFIEGYKEGRQDG